MATSTYTVTIRVNVPSLGTRDVTYAGVVAVDIHDAIRIGIANVVTEVVAIQKTA